MPIAVRQLNFVYNPKTPYEKHALIDVNLEVNDGEFLCIVGHTGSGKSTFVQHLNALVPVQSGFVEVNGLDLTLKKKKLRREMLKQLRGQVGMVFQYPEYQLFEETVYRDIAFGPKNMGLSEEEIRTRVLRAAGFAGVDESLLEKSPFDLSGGQKRRVAIAGVIAMEPEVVIFDEPTAGLDPAGCASILGNIRDYQKATHATILMVTHSMDEVAQLADRMLVLNEGTIEMSGTPREVFSHAARLAEIGLSVPQVTALFLRLRELGVDVDPTTFTVEQAVPQLRALLEGRAHA